MTDEAQANSVFNQLVEGGKTAMPMAKQFWGATFGMVTDKYGIHWMINCEVGAQLNAESATPGATTTK